ncbi:MAG TPA: hypothetical protein VH280_23595 [Verrucomicrobiae bacterium]|nr:hypothetical protein [Verrucomicrobiae bacterium]
MALKCNSSEGIRKPLDYQNVVVEVLHIRVSTSVQLKPSVAGSEHGLIVAIRTITLHNVSRLLDNMSARRQANGQSPVSEIKGDVVAPQRKNRGVKRA